LRCKGGGNTDNPRKETGQSRLVISLLVSSNWRSIEARGCPEELDSDVAERKRSGGNHSVLKISKCSYSPSSTERMLALPERQIVVEEGQQDDGSAL
jgi:hypothetical protein